VILSALNSMFDPDVPEKKIIYSTYSCCDVTKTGLEKVFLKRPFHELIIQAGVRDKLKLFNRLVILAQLGCKRGNLEQTLVRKSIDGGKR